MGGLFAGLTRDTAARFSFLLSIPAIAASGALELKEAIHKLPEGTYLPLIVATIVSGVVGYASIWFLLRFLENALHRSLHRLPVDCWAQLSSWRWPAATSRQTRVRIRVGAVARRKGGRRSFC